MKKAFCIIFTLVISANTFAQSSYFPSGDRGFYMTSEYFSYSNSIVTLYPGVVFSNGWAINGILGIPRIVGPEDPDVRYGEMPLNGQTVLGENIAYRLFSQARGGFPLDISLNSSYRYSFWSRYFMINRYSHRFDAGITLSRRLVADEKLTYIPSLNFKYNYHYTSMPDYFYSFGPIRNSMYYISYTFGFAILLHKVLLSWELDNYSYMNFKDIFTDPFERTRLSVGIIIPHKGDQ